MTEIKVVVEPEAKESAYNWGYDKFEGTDIEDSEDFDLSYYTDSAEYANTVLPKLRVMAGQEDRAGGRPYDRFDETVVVEFPEDRPMDGEIVENQFLFSELVDCFHSGAYDAVDGRERGTSLEF